MVVNRLKLLTFDEEELIKRFIEEGANFPEIEELWQKYNGPLISCLDQLVVSKLRRDIVGSRCPIDQFQKTLRVMIGKEIEDSCNINYAQQLALKELLNEFTCGFECPCCPASILGKVSN